MKVSLKWLRTMVEVPADLKAFASKLDLTGTAVDDIYETGATMEGIVVGHILKRERHPNADTLWVTTVDVGMRNLGENGEPEPLQIVCGAQNFQAGDKVPVALVGAVLPGDVTIKKSKLRGVESRGMNCSARELGLGENHEGIMILPENAPVGAAFSEYLGTSDTVFDLEITPNRPDCMSVFGIAREVGAVYGTPYEMGREVPEPPTKGKAEDFVHVSVEDASRCARYTARIIQGVTIGPSPQWLIDCVTAAGARSINNIVDITNYIMYETGQPLHAFDLDTLVKDAEGKASIVVRAAAEGERFTTLDNVERTLSSDITVIADGNAAGGAGATIALAGVMGGLESEVTDATVNILLESATFNPGHTSRTSRNLKLFSESSSRYERGVDDATCNEFSARAAALMIEVAGGTVAEGVVDRYPARRVIPEIELDMSRLRAFIGAEIGDEEAVAILERLGCEVRKADALGISGTSYASGTSGTSDTSGTSGTSDISSIPSDTSGSSNTLSDTLGAPSDTSGAFFVTPGAPTPDTPSDTPSAVQDPTLALRINSAKALPAHNDSLPPAQNDRDFPTQGDSRFTVIPPSYRPDLERAIDLSEEILRIWGMDRVESRLPGGEGRIGSRTAAQINLDKLGSALRASGLNETMTYAFASRGDNELLGMSFAEGVEPVELINPLGSDQSLLRMSIIPGLLRSVAYNQSHGVSDVQLYELGAVFTIGEGRKLPRERNLLAGVLTGSWNRQGWNEASRPLDFFDAKGVIESVARELCIPKLRFVPLEEEAAPWLAPGQAAEIRSGSVTLGWLGTVHPRSLEAFEAAAPVVAFELEVKQVLSVVAEVREFVPVPVYPAVELDIALVVDATFPAERLVQVARSAGGKLLEDVRIFDVFASAEKLGAGKKSVALSLTYRSDERTLTSEEVDKLHSKVVRKLEGATGGVMRS